MTTITITTRSRHRNSKITTTREATPEEAAAIHADYQRRESAGEAVRTALAKYCPPAEVAAVIASLPEEAQRRLAAKYLVEPPVRRRVKIVTSRKRKP